MRACVCACVHVRVKVDVKIVFSDGALSKQGYRVLFSHRTVRLFVSVCMHNYVCLSVSVSYLMIEEAS